MKAKNSLATIRLRALINWSDRLGSDEVSEITRIIKLLEKNDK